MYLFTFWKLVQQHCLSAYKILNDGTSISHIITYQKFLAIKHLPLALLRTENSVLCFQSDYVYVLKFIWKTLTLYKAKFFFDVQCTITIAKKEHKRVKEGKKKDKGRKAGFSITSERVDVTLWIGYVSPIIDNKTNCPEGFH